MTGVLAATTATTHDWFPVVTLIIGAVIAAVVGLAADLVKSAQQSKREKAAWNRDKKAAAIERALAVTAVAYEPKHAGYEEWTRETALVRFDLRLYCSPAMAAAFESASAGVKVGADSGQFDDPRLEQAISAATPTCRPSAEKSWASRPGRAPRRHVRALWVMTRLGVATE